MIKHDGKCTLKPPRNSSLNLTEYTGKMLAKMLKNQEKAEHFIVWQI